jgi:hypothetical protein
MKKKFSCRGSSASFSFVVGAKNELPKEVEVK